MRWDEVDEDEGSSGEDTDEGEHGAVPGFCVVAFWHTSATNKARYMGRTRKALSADEKR